MSGISKRVSGSWVSGDYGITKTATDTLTTLPADLYPNNTTATVGLKGNMVQNGTPTPDNPVEVNGVGVRTENLFDYQTMLSGVAGHYLSAEGSEIINDYWAITKYIPVDGTTFTLSRTFGGESPSVCLYDVDKHYITGVSYNSNQITTISDSRAKYARFSYFVGYEGQPAENVANDMLVEGSTAPSSYIPPGYKIPILSASTTTPVYLGEVESTRLIRELVLTGEENWRYSTSSRAHWIENVPNDYNNTLISLITTVCTHYRCIRNDTGFSGMVNGDLRLYAKDVSPIAYELYIKDDTYTTAEDFKTYLAQQYAAGTPVTVWYVLATEETGIANEPLRKIGDYADTVSGVVIPTITGKDTFDVDTTLKPSEVSLSYTGWHDATVKEWDGSQWNE